MKRAFCVLCVATLCFSVAYAADTVTPRHMPTAVQARHASLAQSFTVNYVTHQVTPGQLHGRQTPIYDNTANSTGFFGGAFLAGDEVGDDLVMLTGGTVAELDASIGNDPGSAGTVNTCDVTFTFYDYTMTPITNFTTSLDFSSAPLEPGFLATFTITGITGVTVPAKVILTTKITNVVGGADLFDLGLYNPTVTGDSVDAFFSNSGGTPGWFWFTNDPVANFYYGVRVDTTSGDTIIWTDGQERGVVSSGTITNLGFISGRLLSANRPQRWSALPFKVLDPNSTIGKIDIMWFTQAGSEPATVNYKIFRRIGLQAPNDPNLIFAQGVAGTAEPNGGTGPTNWYYSYNVNIPIPVGDYYLTMYGDGNPSQQDAWIAWFTGAEKQDPNLEQPFMWRSESWPTPGFVQYDAGGAIQPGPGATDPLGIWNCTFTLWKTGTPPACPGDMNCDGFVNFGDINPFVAILNGATPCSFANADVNGDGRIDFGDINPFVALLSGGGGPCP